MKYMLYKEPLEMPDDLSVVERLLVHRDIPRDRVQEYLNTTDEKHIHDYNLLGHEALDAGAQMIIDAMSANSPTLLIVDSDCDGFTSAAILINYLYKTNPEWIEKYFWWIMHSGKQHGLVHGIDFYENFDLVIVPDAGSNDYEIHKELADNGIAVLVIDHHEADKVSEHAVVINNQLSDYPNKCLSGAGVTWQFCRFLDKVLGQNFADDDLDLVALGNDADMMSMKNFETKHLIHKGLKKNHVDNPFFYFMADKNKFSLKEKLTPMGVAFYIAPFVNAMTRSGTQEEKIILFKSMLNHEAFERVPSTKRGHKPGDEERIVDQALRIATNVKNRQTKAQTIGMELLESKIVEEDLLANKVLIFKCNSKDIDRNIAGLVANKLMAKYQRHTAVLFKGTNEDGDIIWQGSARGTTNSIISSFRDLCTESGLVFLAQGHASAFGFGIKDENLQAFIDYTNEELANDSGEAVYHVDYIFDNKAVNAAAILEIAEYDYLWGPDMPESLIAIEDLLVYPTMLTLMSPDKRPTLKITLPDGTSLIKFGSSQQEYEKFLTASGQGYVKVNIVGTCNQNEWNGSISPQVLVKDYEITALHSGYIF